LGGTRPEHPPLEQSKTPISTGSGAKSDAHDASKPPQTPKDPDLELVVKCWPNLPEHIKQTIKMLVEKAGTTKDC